MTKLALESAMQKMKNGDNSAFDYIYDNTYKVVFFVVHSILRNSTLAEDIVQDTYIAAYKHRESYQSNNLLAWLTTIAKRLAINEYHRGKHTVFVDFSDEDNKFGEEHVMPDEDSFGLIQLAENTLSPEDFQIVIMCVVSGYKRREVAEILDMPISTVSHRYKQALCALEQKLNKKGGCTYE